MDAEHVNLFQWFLENWQVLFLGIFKYLNDISKTIKKLEIDISVLKYANNIKGTENAKPTQ
jgi:hypothetical protein